MYACLEVLYFVRLVEDVRMKCIVVCVCALSENAVFFSPLYCSFYSILPPSLSLSLSVCVCMCHTVENKDHSDFCLLRQMMIQSHMQDLKDITQEVHYENFRKKKLMQGDAAVK